MNIASSGLGALLQGAPHAQQNKSFQVRGDSRPEQAERVQSGNSAESAKGSDSAKGTASAAQSFDVNGLVDNLWGFMQGRLSEAKASGASEAEMEKMWQAAESGLKQGFSEAKGALEALGKLDEPLNEKIDQARNNLMETLEKRDVNAKAPVMEQADNPSGNGQVQRETSLYQYQERTFALDITTSEGDQITVRVQNSSEASARQSNSEGRSVTEWGRTDSNSFQLQIQGDLNDQERADLDQLLGEVDTLANEFYDGDLNVAWDQAKALDIDGTSLASMDLGMRSVEAKGAAAYQQQSGSSSQLPRGLAPLQQYARDMIDSQEQWRERLDSNQGLQNALENHPRNEGKLGQMAQQLLGG